MLAIKIALTVALICGVSALCMVMVDNDPLKPAGQTYRLWGGGLIIITIVSLVFAGVVAIWEFLP